MKLRSFVSLHESGMTSGHYSLAPRAVPLAELINLVEIESYDTPRRHTKCTARLAGEKNAWQFSRDHKFRADFEFLSVSSGALPLLVAVRRFPIALAQQQFRDTFNDHLF